jgi:hypothetical protein
MTYNETTHVRHLHVKNNYLKKDHRYLKKCYAQFILVHKNPLQQNKRAISGFKQGRLAGKTGGLGQ